MTAPLTLLRRVLSGALASLTLATAACAARAAGDPTDASQSIDVAGTTRTYVLHVPAKLGEHVGLIVAFHGHLGTGANMAKLSGLDTPADRDGMIVAYPDGIDRGWNDGRAQNANGADDLAFAAALVDELVKRYPIDRKRIYATGFSNGGTFSNYLACNEANRFAAIATVSGSMPVVDAPQCKPARAISVLSISGTADPIMPYAGGSIKLGGVDRGQVLSAAQTAAFWANNAGCAATAVSAPLAPIAPADGTSVARTIYRDCKNGAGVVLYAVNDGGHTWPGGPQYLPKALIGPASDQLDASATIVAFFLAHPQP